MADISVSTTHKQCLFEAIIISSAGWVKVSKHALGLLLIRLEDQSRPGSGHIGMTYVGPKEILFADTRTSDAYALVGTSCLRLF